VLRPWPAGVGRGSLVTVLVLQLRFNARLAKRSLGNPACQQRQTKVAGQFDGRFAVGGADQLGVARGTLDDQRCAAERGFDFGGDGEVCSDHVDSLGQIKNAPSDCQPLISKPPKWLGLRRPVGLTTA